VTRDDHRKETLIPKHGGYRKLLSFQVAQLVYDVTVRFCERYVDKFSRTKDQMVQAARSGVQNIAEGSEASATSKKTEIKLTQVARASLEELKLDYEDFLRQRGLPLWPLDDPRRRALVAGRPGSADDFAQWVRWARGDNGPDGPENGPDRPGKNGPRVEADLSMASLPSMPSISPFPEIAANGAHALIGVACSLLDRQVERLASDFETEGGFTERLYRVRTAKRKNK
jgi:four helix bundle suffix protein